MDDTARQPPEFTHEDWRRIRDALRYLGRDLHRRSYAVDAQRRELLWAEMDACLLLAERIGNSLHEP
ncbi:hypothetical protein [Synechococcus sp. CBW1107]|uniref:hypothetical protein n=1 Tax=Synechococcus sp. CBW1107 TaxID=2789857 RepID=UPI002AD50DFB|nr:hypothetical protein [Synechococcus sp. CBW1107]CAK6691719.1 hypothetical protein ICNINCKA_01068 [Synechococcus sp. CBW1107]